MLFSPSQFQRHETSHLAPRSSILNISRTPCPLQYGDSPLHYACFCGHLEAAKTLVAAGADPHRPSKDGKTPLQSAREEGHQVVVDFLSKGAAAAAAAAAAANGSSAAVPPPPSSSLPPPPPSAGNALPPAPPAPAAAPPPGPPPASTAVAGSDSSAAAGNSVAGLDFTRGVIMEGELKKKRANKVMRWRSKYYVLSRTYGALFFWTGTRTRVEGVIKKVRFETFLNVKYYPEKHGGKRFDLRVITGRTMCLLTNTTEEAKRWVDTLTSVLGSIMAAIRIQAVWRGYRARQRLKKMKEERKAAVASIAGHAVTSATAGGAKKLLHGAIKDDGKAASVTMSNTGILIEGELKKKNSQAMASLLSGYRSRYFVLHKGDAMLYYFESKAQRNSGSKPRAIPLESFYDVTHVADKKGAHKTRTFVLKVVSGRSFVFDARSPEEAGEWTKHLASVLPKTTVAAIKIQRNVRMLLAKKLRRKLAAEAAASVARLEGVYGKPAAVMHAAAARITARWRGVRARRRFATLKAARAQALASVQSLASLPPPPPPMGMTSGVMTSLPPPPPPPVAAAQVAGTAAAGSSGAGALPLPPPPPPAVTSASSAFGGSVLPPPPPPPITSASLRPARWIAKTEPSSGRQFYANVDSGVTSWEPPSGVAGGSALLITGWFAKLAPSGDKPFYVHAGTGATVWELPHGEAHVSLEGVMVPPGGSAVRALPPPPPLPPASVAGSATSGSLPPPPPLPPAGAASDWVQLTDPASGQPYFFNRANGERTFVRPADYNPAAASAAGPAGLPAGAKKKAPAPMSLAPTGSRASRIAALAGKPAAGGAGAAGSNSSAAAAAGASASPSSAAAAAAFGARAHALAHPSSSSSSSSASSASPSSAGGGGKRCIAVKRSGGAFVDLLDDAVAAVALLPPPPPGSGGPPADPWKPAVDGRSNRPFFLHTGTGESAWYRPGTEPPSADVADSDPNEALTYACWINEALGKDPELTAAKLVPVGTDPASLCTALRDGRILARLVTSVGGYVHPGVINPAAKASDPLPVVDPGAEKLTSQCGMGLDFTALLERGPGSGAFPSLDNCRAGLNAAAAAGVAFPPSVTPLSLASGRPRAVLDALWALFKAGFSAGGALAPRALGPAGLALLGRDGESGEELLALKPEALLTRWASYQLEAVGCELAHSALTAAPGLGWADGVAFCALVRSVAPAVCGEVPPTDAAARAAGPVAAVTASLAAAFAAGVPAWFSVEGITGSNTRLQTAVLSYLLRAAPCMSPPRRPLPNTASGAGSRYRKVTSPPADATVARLIGEIGTALAREATETAGAPALLDPLSGSLAREARSLASWANGLHVQGVTLRPGLGEAVRDLRDGVPLLRLMDCVEPGLVNWARAAVRPGVGGKVKCVENCATAVNLGRAMDFAGLASVSGLDLAEGAKGGRTALAFLWQLARYATFKALSGLAFDGFAPTESDILTWANERVADAVAKAPGGQDGAAIRVPSWKDPELASGLYLLYLLSAVRPGCVDWKQVTEGTSLADQEANARYLLSVAAMVGVPPPLPSWQDVVAVKPRSLLLLIGGIMLLDTSIRKLKEGDDDDDGSDSDDE